MTLQEQYLEKFGTEFPDGTWENVCKECGAIWLHHTNADCLKYPVPACAYAWKKSDLASPALPVPHSGKLNKVTGVSSKSTFPVCDAHLPHYKANSDLYICGENPGTICECKKQNWSSESCGGDISWEYHAIGTVNGILNPWVMFCEKHGKIYEEFKTEENLRRIAPRPRIDGYDGGVWKPVTPYSPPPETGKVDYPKTQKAKGMKILRENYFPIPDFHIWNPTKVSPAELIGRFTRPCPIRPRHGFVDSRIVRTEEEAKAVIAETLAADPESELITMPFINAPFSGIWTEGYLAVGLGTDGATAGKTAITVPVLGDFLQSVNSRFREDRRKAAGIENAPYVELLWQKDYDEDDYSWRTVQLRDGPKLPSNSGDYIPQPIKVEAVIIADGDLLEWEEKMRHVSPGTVVYHPGGSLASHYAIHAVLNNVPILISREPKVGETIEPTVAVETGHDIQALRAGFTLACQMQLSYAEAAFFMLSGCHNIVTWRGKHDLLLGAAMGCAWRLTVAAALGEKRHYRRKSDGSLNPPKVSRDTVYKKLWKKADTQGGRSRFVKAVDLFLNSKNWPSSNFGGYSWYKFTVNAVNMYNALVAKDSSKALEALNQLVHSAHNTGWGFNKFITDNDLNKTAEHPIYSVIRCAPYIYQVLSADHGVLKQAARTWWKRFALPVPENKGTGIKKEPRPIDPETGRCNCPECREAGKNSVPIAAIPWRYVQSKLQML